MIADQVLIEKIAQVCHEANRAYCESLGDHSQKPWAETPQEIRASAIDGVTYRLKFPHASPGASHRNWLAYKVAEGWKYGPVKDMIKKEHPCCVPFDDLPEEQQRKDVLFASIVASLSTPISEVVS